MPNAQTGNVMVTRYCQYEQYVEGKIPSIFKIDDKVEVNDLPFFESGIDSQYDINRLTINGHECKIGQYLIRVGSALFVVDDPELCGIIATTWTDERVPEGNYGDRWRRGHTVDRIVIDDQIHDNHAHDAVRYESIPSRRYTELGAELHHDEVARYRGRVYDRPLAERIQESRRTIDRNEPTLDRATLEHMMEAAPHSTGTSFSREELDALVEEHRRQ